jgi:hypothetical protein
VILDDGSLVYQDPLSNDLVKMNLEMKELARLPGVPIDESLKSSAAGFNKSRKSCFVDAGDEKILWLKSLNQISIVDVETFHEQEI